MEQLVVGPEREPWETWISCSKVADFNSLTTENQRAKTIHQGLQHKCSQADHRPVKSFGN